MTHSSDAPLFAEFCLVALNLGSGKLTGAELTFGGQFADCLFDSQVARAELTADDRPAVRASGGLVTETRICQEVSKTTGTHQVAVGALQNHSRKRRITMGATAEHSPPGKLLR